MEENQHKFEAEISKIAGRQELKEKYCNNLWNDIKNHWLKLSQDEISIECVDSPWFGNISGWWDAVGEISDDSVFEKFPSSIHSNLSKIGYELHNLLPQTDLVKAFLPVLLTSYINHYPKRTDFLDLLTQADVDISRIEDGKTLWIMKPLHDSYQKLTAKDCKVRNIQRTLPIYLQAVQFLVFLVNTAPICNVGLSFFLFEQMTGYLHLLGKSAEHYLELLSTKDIEQLLNKKTEYDDQIVRYSQGVIDDLKYLKYKMFSSDKRVKYTRSPRFLTFLANLEDELSPSNVSAGEIGEIDFSDWRQSHRAAQFFDRR